MTLKFGKHIFIVLLLLSISYVCFAQREQHVYMQGGKPAPPRGYNKSYKLPQEHVRPILQIKENYISKQLALSPEQTLRFEAVYHSYQQERGAVRVLKRLNNSDAQANGTDQLNKDMAYERQLVDIKDRYTQEFLRIMPPEKVSVIFKSERQFDDEALRILKEKEKNAGTSPPPAN